MSQIEQIVLDLAKLAKNASYKLAAISREEKIAALNSIAKVINEDRSVIKASNLIDLKLAHEAKLKDSLIERLTLNDIRINEMIASVESIAKLPDPVGKLITSKVLANQIELKKIRVPIGVIGIIFESRPNVVCDVAALCLMSGNAVILRGGKEAEHSNRAIMNSIDRALKKVDFVPFAVQIIPVQDRAALNYMCKLDKFIDVIIPRGGEGLIRAISDAATVPLIKHYKGVCHVYVDKSADLKMALAICHNAKCQRPSVCNAAETILVHEDVAKDFLPILSKDLSLAGVTMLGCERSRQIVKSMEVASEQDWYEEYLELKVAIKVVKSLDEAIYHINNYGSHHSDAIIATDKAAHNRFAREVDSAVVYLNASTRFTDGFVFGLGAEMGISTDKLHARGPMGLTELTTYKWVAHGDGQIRS